MALRRIVAYEDGASNRSSIVSSRQVPYTDIDLSFTAKPGAGNGELGDIYKKFDVGAVLQAVKNIVLTDKGEKPFNPDFGVGVSNQLFELNDSVTRNRISRQLQNNVLYYEPRVSINSIEIRSREDTYELSISIELVIRNTNEVVNFTTYVNRLR